jgi:hypothetical protein
VSVEFTHIGKEVPTMLGKHYDGAERVETLQQQRNKRDKLLADVRKTQSDGTRAFEQFAKNLKPKTAEEKRQEEISKNLTNRLSGGTQNSTDHKLNFDTSFSSKLTG